MGDHGSWVDFDPRHRARMAGSHPPSSPMTGNLQAIGFIASWVLGWGIGGSLIDAGLINAGIYAIDTNQLGTLVTFTVWTVLWAGLGYRLFRRFTA